MTLASVDLHTYDDSVGPAVDAALASDGASSTCRLLGLLGEGGMARVYLARHDGLGRRVAVKRLRPQLAHQAHARDRLCAEADLVRTIDNQHVVNVLDVVDDPDGESYFVMEHLAGEPLAARLARVGALPLSEGLLIALQIAEAMEAIHRRGILHRDLKSENVLVGFDPGGGLSAKLIDFGVAEVLGQSGQLVCNTVVGTPESMSPEQATGGAVDLRSDIYSFGVLVYEMITGGAPFQGPMVDEVLRRVVSEVPVPPSACPGAQRQLVPQALEQLVLECLQKSPSDRPQSMSQVRRRLAAIDAEYRRQVQALESAMSEEGGRGGAALRPGTGGGVVPVWLLDDAAAGAGCAGADPDDDADREVEIEIIAPGPDSVPLPLVARGSGSDLDLPDSGSDLDLPIDDEPAPVVHVPTPRAEVLPAATPRLSSGRRLGRLAAWALVLSVVTVGVLVLMGYVPWTPKQLQLWWHP